MTNARIGLLVALIAQAACTGAGTTGAGGGTGVGGGTTSGGGAGGSGGGTAGGSGGGTAGGSGGGTAGGSGGGTAGGSGGGTAGGSGGGAAGGSGGGTAGGSGGGTAGGSGGGAAGGSGGAGGAGMTCTWLTDGGTPCPSTQYCDAPGCTTGTCKPIPTTQQPGKNPVCGCDGLDYWNATVSASKGMAYKSSGTCAMTHFCGGIAGIPCPGGGSCSYEVPSKNDCNVSDPGGRCWVLPSTCAGPAIGPNTRACGSLSCTDECNLSKLQVLWYVDNTCPQ